MSPGFFVLAAIVFVAGFTLSRWRSSHSIPVSSRKIPPVKDQKTQRTQIESISPQKELELRELVKRGAKIQAIKQVRRLTNLGLKESKDYLDGLVNFRQARSLANQVPAGLKNDLKHLVQRNQRIQAIKQLRTYTGWGLKQSKDYIDRL